MLLAETTIADQSLLKIALRSANQVDVFSMGVIVRKGGRMAFASKLARRQRLSETYQILRSHANNASAWAVNFRYKKERDRRHKWQDQHLDAFGFSLSCTIANQQVGAHGDRCRSYPKPQGGCGPTMQPVCIPGSSTLRSCPKWPGRALVSLASQPGHGRRTTARSAIEQYWY